MSPSAGLRYFLAVSCSLGLTLPDAFCLLRFNGGKDQVHLSIAGSAGWDSNIFSSADSRGDSLLTASLIADYQRRAGMIGMDASAGVEAGYFAETHSENYVNPRASVEFTKSSGRTTGSWVAAAARKSEGDVAANVRAESWDYTSELNLKYPVIERYSLAGSFGYELKDYLNSDFLVDLESYHTSADLFYSLNSQRDLIAGYRFRTSDSERDVRSRDHAFLLGLSGKIFPKITGTIRTGYQTRETRGPQLRETHDGLTASMAATWTMNRRTSLTGQFTKDFSTTSTDVSTASSAATIDLKRTLNSRWSAVSSIGFGRLDFLGNRGIGRRDTYLTAMLALTWKRNEHFSMSSSYAYLNNWSSLALADYHRHAINLSVNLRY